MPSAGLRPAVDDAVLLSLQEIIGREALDGLIDVLLETTPRICAAVLHALRVGDIAALRASTHQLKGSTANLGATRLPAMCEEVEAYVRAGDLAAARSLAHWLGSEYQQVHEHLERVRGKGIAAPVSGVA